MSSNKATESEAKHSPSSAKRDLVIAAIVLVVVVGLSFGALTLFSDRPVYRDTLNEADLPVGEKPLDLTIIHTNDTWGYLTGCG